jgi:ABC-type lipopolysaccharide export system ATPase subunit
VEANAGEPKIALAPWPLTRNCILLDEPFAGVDPSRVEDIQAVVAKLQVQEHRHIDHPTTT